jgi:hypothetical protein
LIKFLGTLRTWWAWRKDAPKERREDMVAREEVIHVDKRATARQA